MTKTLFFSLFIIALVLTGCTIPLINDNQNQNGGQNNESGQNGQNNQSNQGNNQASLNGNFVGSFYKGNYVWGGAMNLAWNEMSENIIKGEVKLETNDPTALAMVDKFNDAVFGKNDLDEASYYVKSGFGQTTVEQINREAKAKFPDKSFGDLVIDPPLTIRDFISYAYFLKAVEYATQFKEDDVTFDSMDAGARPTRVKGFYALNSEQRDNIQVLSYDNDNKFIIALKLKDNGDQLILAKGYTMQNPTAVVSAVQQVANNKVGYGIAEQEQFRMPKLHLNYRRDYKELINKFFANTGFEDYIISQMFENIKFDLDHKGARVENEAVIIGLETSVPIEPPVIRNFILDKPFWVIMKRTASQNPYFLLGVNNTELMEK